MNTIISVLLLFTYNSLHKDIYYLISKYILEHLDEVENMSIGKLAVDCGTSTATINKFCNLIGVDSFKGFKSLLMNTRVGRLNQIKERYQQFNEEILFSQIQHLSQNVIEKEIFLNKIDELVKLIHNSQQIYLLGAIYPLALSLNFVEDMKIFKKDISLEQIGFMSSNNNYQKDDLILFITINGRIITHNRQGFLRLYESPAKKVVISQNRIFEDFHDLDDFIKLEDNNDNEVENIIIIEILNLIKYKYYTKYINNYH
ncbi:MAG: hypothetical protein RR630_04030 [Coprobacillus sp.]